MLLVPKIGIVVVAGLGVGFVFGLAILDAWLGVRDEPTIGDRLVTWTKKNPWFAAASTFILGVLISHFFWPGAEGLPPFSGIGIAERDRLMYGEPTPELGFPVGLGLAARGEVREAVRWARRAEETATGLILVAGPLAKICSLKAFASVAGGLTPTMPASPKVRRSLASQSHFHFW